MNRAIFWLRLLKTPGVGPAQARALLEHPDSPGPAGADDPKLLAHCGWSEASIRAFQRLDEGDLAIELAWLSHPAHHLLGLDDPAYPALLRDTPDAPAALFVRGEPRLLAAPQVAVVGSRNPTRGGLDNAREFAAFIARQGVVVTSGLAQGIDSAAHEGALDGGTTIAVTGTGLDRVYPAASQPLAEAIAEQGALVSEFLPGTPPRRENFPRRNRIISGMSLGTLVVEAARRSGSLITARLASEQGREVFAIPGSIHNPMARGCHQLIRQGAKLVETAADIFEELGQLALVAQAGSLPGEAGAGPETAAERDPEYVKLLDAMGWDPVSLDELARRTGLTTGVLSSMLLILELEGEVTPGHGGHYARVPRRGR